MNKNLVSGLVLFILTEILCVVALFSSKWITSSHIGSVGLGLLVLCHSPPDLDQLCTFTFLHLAWLACSLIMIGTLVVFGLSICFLIVALHRRSKFFEKVAQWSGLGGTLLLCMVGVLFPVGFSSLELGGHAFFLPKTYSIGYSYILFNMAIFFSIFAVMASNKLLQQRLYMRIPRVNRM